MFSRMFAIWLMFLCTAAVAGTAPPPAPASSSSGDAALFLGLTWTFGNNTSNDGSAGLSLKILSTNEEDEGAVAGGVTYNFDGTFGCDLGIAYNAEDVTATASYDFCRNAPQFGLGVHSD